MFRNRSPQAVAISFSLFISVTFIILSLLGTIAPVENIAHIPLSFLESIFGDISGWVDETAAELVELRTLRERNKELEASLALFQAEVAESREIRSDYERLAALVNYVRTTSSDWRYVAADVIGQDTLPTVRTIHLNRGTRDGVSLNDPVVTELGLVGRVTQISATGCEVLLITDQTSSINVRLQTSRSKGLVQGTLSGDLLLAYVDTDGAIRPGDLVLTSGETQIFPADLVVGQVGNASLSADKLFQEAPLTSFIDFSRLEIVLIITNWDPVNVQIFQSESGN